jgi:hypothetical protein
VLGNAADEADVQWVPEFVLDWHMHYRSEGDLRDLASDLGGVAKIDIEKDLSGAWYFLVIRRL